MTDNYFCQESKSREENREELTVQGIPFRVTRENKVIAGISIGDELPFPGKYEALFFLGMATRIGEGSEWWGPAERNYDFTQRLFFGDRIGQIHIIYEDGTQEIASVIFGVNAWNYDLFEPVKEWEADQIVTWSGPHREPFASDPEAEKLRLAALHMLENTGENAEKASKWVFCFKTRPDKAVRAICMREEGYKKAGFVVSAVTGLKAGEPVNAEWPVVDTDFFLRRDYAEAIDKLSRRLYQYQDEIPEHDELITPENFDAPDVRFAGNGYADILTNVYRANIMDMAYDKIDDSGRGHTSSKGAPYFGCYVGFGTWSNDQGSYYDHIWSRDVGRTMAEVMYAGYPDRIARCVEDLHVQLYNPSLRFHAPNWKRIANLTEEFGDVWKTLQGKENDGHAALMLGIYTYYLRSGVGKSWLLERRQPLFDAANWIFWQIEHPEESNFDRVLYSESEASTQIWGGYDLFSNVQCIFALSGYAKMFDDMEETETAKKCRETAELLWNGCMERFGQKNYKYGTVLTDTTDDCWTWEYKRFAPLFLMADVAGYDVLTDRKELFDLMNRTFEAQKEEYYAPEAGRQMGYGQGYLTEAAILLDRYEEMTECVEAAAKFCYHHTDLPYIVPEGVILHGSKRCWFRNSDLGNAVQQGEIIKSIRLLAGIDDISPERGLRLIPRIPDTFDSIEVKDYPILCCTEDGRKTVSAGISYTREGDGYHFRFRSEEAIAVERLRVGPFDRDAEIGTAAVTGCGGAGSAGFECTGVRSEEIGGGAAGCDEFGQRELIIQNRKFVYIDINRSVSELDVRI